MRRDLSTRSIAPSRPWIGWVGGTFTSLDWTSWYCALPQVEHVACQATEDSVSLALPSMLPLILHWFGFGGLAPFPVVSFLNLFVLGVIDFWFFWVLGWGRWVCSRPSPWSDDAPAASCTGAEHWSLYLSDELLRDFFLCHGSFHELYYWDRVLRIPLRDEDTYNRTTPWSIVATVTCMPFQQYLCMALPS